MDINRVYLLIILVVSPYMSWMTSKIMCDHRIILVYVNRTRTMESMVAQCIEQTTLLVPITLPSVEVRITEWQNMTAAQQGTEVFSLLKHMLNVTQNIKTTECFSKQIKKLQHSVREIQGLVHRAWRFANNNTNLNPESNNGSYHLRYTNSSDITDIFKNFSKLLQGKVTFLMQTLREGNC
ncbi:PREDICTED: thrombopoietin [Nanorana parkeri]|uniref:thrombopoietin n=1 Tax=Nanorana parkeri TaxID=125878 RepID=UPI000854FD8F|nr:PREDICTED: thrombopoietin [Nanorana parkeri]